MFSLGTAEARAAGLHDAARLTDATAFGDTPTDLDGVRAELARVPVAASTRWDLAEAAGEAVPTFTAGILPCTAMDPVALGGDAHRLRCVLLAAGLTSARIASHGLNTVVYAVGGR